jgi:hypothetical protein
MVQRRAVPTARAMLADIDAILGFGVRRPGSPGDRAATDWAARRFTELGLQDVTFEPVELLACLEPLTRAAIRVIESVRGRTAAELRALAAGT